jgi:hypothetical protein
MVMAQCPMPALMQEQRLRPLLRALLPARAGVPRPAAATCGGGMRHRTHNRAQLSIERPPWRTRRPHTSRPRGIDTRSSTWPIVHVLLPPLVRFLVTDQTVSIDPD